MGNVRLARIQAEKQGWKCFYCEGHMWLPSSEKRTVACERMGITPKQLVHRTATREHLERQVDGGHRTPDNIVAACSYCNTNRWKFSVEEHKARMMKKVAEGTHPTASVPILEQVV